MRRDRWWWWANRHGFGLGLGLVEILVYFNPPGDRPDDVWR